MALRNILAKTYLLMIWIAGFSQSLIYLWDAKIIDASKISIFNFSPRPIAFVHPSFFQRKLLRLVYKDHQIEIDPLTLPKHMSNRMFYRLIMFTNEIPLMDRISISQYLLCSEFITTPITRHLSGPLLEIHIIHNPLGDVPPLIWRINCDKKSY